MVKQKLLDDAEVCVSLPRLIAEKELISPEIVQLDTVEKTAASIIFLYNKSAPELKFYGQPFIAQFSRILKQIFDE